MREAWMCLPACETKLRNRRLLGGRDRVDGDGVVLFGAVNGDFRASLLVERGQCSFVAGLEGINLVADDQSVLRTLSDASAGAGRVVAGHGVLGSAHGITHGAREALAFCGERRRNGQS